MNVSYRQLVAFFFYFTLAIVAVGDDDFRLDILEPPNSPLNIGYYSPRSEQYHVGIEGRILLPIKKSEDIDESRFKTLFESDMVLQELIRDAISIQIEGVIKYQKERKLFVDDPIKGHASIEKIVWNENDAEIFYRLSTDYLLIKDHPMNNERNETGNYENLFYYPPGRSDISLSAPIDPANPESQRVAVTLFVEKEQPLAEKTSYPEYDQFVKNSFEDKYTLEIALMFGEFSEGDEYDNDNLDYDMLVSKLQRMGFRQVPTSTDDETDESQGYRTRWELVNSFDYLSDGGRIKPPVIKIDLYTPEYLNLDMNTSEMADHFHKVLKKNEIVYYFGHTFVSSNRDLRWINDLQHYPSKTYQILYLDGCYSQQHGAKTAFQSHVTEEDPQGDRYLDFIGNAWRGYGGSPIGFSRMLESIIRSTTLVYYYSHGSGRIANNRNISSWDQIIGELNEDAIYRSKASPTPRFAEVMGASGIRNNRFNPNTH